MFAAAGKPAAGGGEAKPNPMLSMMKKQQAN